MRKLITALQGKRKGGDEMGKGMLLSEVSAKKKGRKD